MKIRLLILLSLVFNINFAQKKHCNIDYNFVKKVFSLESIENIDYQLNKKGYVFSFNEDYTNYWNKLQKSNFSIHWDRQKTTIKFIRVDVNKLCYDNFKQELIKLGFKKIHEEMTKYNITLFYKKNDEYYFLAKVNTYDINGNVTDNGFAVSMTTIEKYNEYIKNGVIKDE